MTRYLLAADADKIQDFIFRSAHLQEVIGGSHLLSRFCDDGLEKLNDHYATAKYPGNWIKNEDWQAIINDGGRFLLSFKDKERAEEFGRDLMELYRRAVQSSLTTVVDETPYDSDDNAQFKKANERVKEKLERAKLSAHGVLPTEHIPQMAFCASCGVDVAVEHALLYENEMYLCDSCIKKRDERDEYRVGPSHAQKKLFINEFRDAINKVFEEKTQQLCKDKLWLPAKPVDAISQYDPRSYVAYLLADGNSMGELFGSCDDPEQMSQLSKELTNSIHAALADPTFDLKSQLDARYGNEKLREREKGDPEKLKDVLPVVPLILGGDDIFVLLPAPYAVNFTQRFIKAYEGIMKEVIDRLKIETEKKPTLSTVVVICKSNHPYKLAHQHGEARLKLAKKMAKTFCSGEHRSVIDIDLILSSERRNTSESQQENPFYQPTLTPFWADEIANEAGISIRQLIEARKTLKELPNKRLAQLRELYYETNVPKDKLESKQLWERKLKHLLERIDRMDTSGKNLGNLNDVLKSLGSNVAEDFPGCWKTVQRETATYDAHALPDLLRLWDYCYDLNEAIEFYE